MYDIYTHVGLYNPEAPFQIIIINATLQNDLRRMKSYREGILYQKSFRPTRKDANCWATNPVNFLYKVWLPAFKIPLIKNHITEKKILYYIKLTFLSFLIREKLI